MATGQKWEQGYRPSRLRGPERDLRSCPNGRARCTCCSRPDLVAYRVGRVADLSDWGDLEDCDDM